MESRNYEDCPLYDDSAYLRWSSPDRLTVFRVWGAGLLTIFVLVALLTAVL